MIWQLIRLLRPKQWVKNVFVLLPLFFSGEFASWVRMRGTLIGVLAFCLVASSTYCFNDIVDRERDRRHPRKRLRPVASGAVSVAAAYAMMLLLVILSIATLFLLPVAERADAIIVIIVYFLMNIAYTLWLKRIGIVDVMIVAFGFVLRMVMGGIASDVELSQWIILMTFLLALFLAMGKRRDDLMIATKEGHDAPMRASVAGYSLTFVNQVLTILATVTLVCYIMYTVSPETTMRLGSRYLYTTALWVLAGIIRYLKVLFADDGGGSPTEVLLHDRFLQCCLSLWVVNFALLLYL